MSTKLTAIGAIGLLGLVSLVSGCGSSSVKNTTAPATKTQSKPQTLVIYSAQGYDKAEAIAFQKATGIKVKLDDMSTGPLLAKVQSEGNHPQWDVIWFDGNGSMSTLSSQHMLYTGYTPTNASRYNQLGKKLLPTNHAYFPTGVTGAIAFAYNTKLLKKSQVPTTWQGLLSPSLKGVVGMNNPAISGPTYPFVAGLFNKMGVTQGKKFFTQLKANGLQVFNTNGVTLHALETGAIKIAMVQDSAEWSAKAKGAPISVIYPTNGTPMLPSDMAISKNAKNLKAAKMFINFVLSRQGQKVMRTKGGGDSLFSPVIKGEIPNPLRPNVKINWFVVNPTWAGKHQKNWLNWFTNNIVGQ